MPQKYHYRKPINIFRLLAVLVLIAIPTAIVLLYFTTYSSFKNVAYKNYSVLTIRETLERSLLSSKFSYSIFGSVTVKGINKFNGDKCSFVFTRKGELIELTVNGVKLFNDQDTYYETLYNETIKMLFLNSTLNEYGPKKVSEALSDYFNTYTIKVQNEPFRAVLEINGVSKLAEYIKILVNVTRQNDKLSFVISEMVLNGSELSASQMTTALSKMFGKMDSSNLVSIVKDSYLNEYPGKKIGEYFEKFFPSFSWAIKDPTNGIVLFVGRGNFGGQDKIASVEFVVSKSGAVSIAKFTLDNEELQKVYYVYYLDKIFSQDFSAQLPPSQPTEKVDKALEESKLAEESQVTQSPSQQVPQVPQTQPEQVKPQPTQETTTETGSTLKASANKLVDSLSKRASNVTYSVDEKAKTIQVTCNFTHAGKNRKLNLSYSVDGSENTILYNLTVDGIVPIQTVRTYLIDKLEGKTPNTAGIINYVSNYVVSKKRLNEIFIGTWSVDTTKDIVQFVSSDGQIKFSTYVEPNGKLSPISLNMGFVNYNSPEYILEAIKGLEEGNDE